MTLPATLVVTTARCRLRQPELRDVEHVWTASRVPGFTDGMRWDPPERLEELHERHAETLAAWADGRWYSFAAETHDGAFVGRISLAREPDPDVWSLGFWIHPTQQRRGFATELATALVAIGFERLGARAIRASHVDWNDASRRVLLHLGFRHVRRDPEGHVKGGRKLPLDTYELQRPARPPGA